MLREFHARFRAVATHLLMLVAFAPVVASGQTAVPEASRQKVDFAREVQPILAKRCFFCHGNDKAEGGLRLNKRESVIAALESGEHAVVPGNIEKSALLQRISSTEESERMPPEGKPLAPEQIETLRRWISEGAKWEEHWAFRAPEKQEPPAVAAPAWVTNPIDAFILQKLEQRGLKPAAPAEKAALIRRAYYDLTGLPPTAAEVEAFVKDASPKAFETVIDTLLESPGYGEHWARHWLDVVRYADTNSFERDGNKPHSWRYRDYVIRAFNEDKPYDQFVREQLAGDELPQVTNDSLIATGYYRLGLWDDEPADRLLAKFDVLDDLVATTSQVFLGLTVNCARCHDHKIDPIPQKEYYSLVSFFHGITPNGTTGPHVERQLFPDASSKQKYEAELQALTAKRNQKQAAITAIENEFRTKFEKSQGPATQVGQVDMDELEYRFYRDHWDKLPDFDNLKPETVDKLPLGLFDISPTTRSTEFGFVFTGVLKVPADGEYTFSLDSDDGSRLILDGKKILEYDGIHGEGSPKQATVNLTAGRLPIRLEYFQRSNGLGLTASWSGPGFLTRPLTATQKDSQPKSIADQIKIVGSKLLGEVKFKEYNHLSEQLERLKNDRIPGDYALAVSEFGSQAPDTFLLFRGNPNLSRDKVEPGFLSIIGGGAATIPKPAPDAKSSGRRLVLANWIASPENRMTSRVMVNRIWQHHFGRGLVRSPNNFGQLGDLPTHPELLDWLAAEFIKQGWHMKSFHKLLMLSSTYQMSSRPDKLALEKDAGNDLFSRFDMRRLSAEEIRDTIHVVNGTLNPKMFGPGYYPEISAEVLAGQSSPGSGWGKSSAEEQARRSIYIHVKRSLITPLLADFDFADTDSSCAARFATTQPTQALGMLNGDFLNGQATLLAARLKREAGDVPEQQVRLALRLTLNREPDAASVARGLDLLKSLKEKYKLDSDQILKYYCLLVYNLNEFVYLD
jgi:hypothetical protein